MGGLQVSRLIFTQLGTSMTDTNSLPPFLMDVFSTPQNKLLFISCENSPEELIMEFAKYALSQKVFMVCQTTIQEPWHDGSQKLVLCYFIQNNKIVSFSIDSDEKLLLHKKGIEHLYKNKTITVNDDATDFATVEKDYFAQKNIFQFNQPLIFDPVYIAKPWGQEIWFTGVEKRGVCQISPLNNPQNISLPIPWFFAALPSTYLGEKYKEKNLVLIKILDPLAQEVKGDLYYELHQEKNEVYVVTQISSEKGRIKIGIHPDKLKSFQGREEILKTEFQQSIEQYEIIRRKIDDLKPGDTIDQNLQKEEAVLRKKMDEYAGFLDLKVGDVIAVPILVPHALQHGVRVVEFQTPTYERLIISFAQKVLTQNHWDTKKAFDVMKLQAPQKSSLKIFHKSPQCLQEFVCHFPDFSALRVTLQKLSNFILPALTYYEVLFFIDGHGELIMEGVSYEIKPGQCIFRPAFVESVLKSASHLVFLVCRPENFNSLEQK